MDHDSAARGRTALDHYITAGHGSADDLPTAFDDLVADLIIYAALEGVDWENGLGRAERYATDDDGDFCPSCSSPTPAVALRCPSCSADHSSPEPACPTAPSAATS